ncbi:MAG: Fic family protein [Lachnospiraceae bacterium]|nr:Fic family protein [Lachnospiraceae bacterium]
MKGNDLKRNFERIHLFFDGNGRTGRILSNILFLQSGYGYVTIPPEYRVEYFDSIEYNTPHEFFADRMIHSMEYIDEMHMNKL